ncbi:MAG: hypothetical protein F9K24_14755 [Leptonema illini]|uniref:Uncharacterized protein n=1 Tax=Leptonema illini TaxID=183 RepID=A0A833GZK3_9LEPT|nr:MAG: hypothetical protein F9K24_14755 [Leptonema illini]
MESLGLPRSTRLTGYQAQHIIPIELATHPIIKKIGMNFDDAANGIFLRIPDDGISTLSRHRGYHSVYNDAVRKALDRLDIGQTIMALENEVFNLQKRLKRIQQQGTPLYRSQGATAELWERLINQ